MNTDKNITSKIEVTIKLANHWKATMPAKPRQKGSSGAGWRHWNGLERALDLYIEFARAYESILDNAPFPNQRFIVNRGTEKILQGFSILSRACEQRRGKVTSDSLPLFLAQAEDRLEMYLSQWKADQNGDAYLKLITPVVYFEKRYDINRSLYGPEIPIISIPLSLYDQTDEWQALAHEMGHHFYWNTIDDLEEVETLHAKMLESIRRSITANVMKPPKGALDAWEHWTEEVFADVCGTLLSGPEYVISCQNTAAEKAKKPSDLAIHDNEHPAAYLRPIIAVQVLRELDGAGEALPMINDLEARWKKYSQGVATEPCRQEHEAVKNEERQLLLSDLEEQVEAVVHAFLNDSIWPYDKKLLDLISRYRRDSYQIIAAKGLDELTPIYEGAKGSRPSFQPDRLLQTKIRTLSEVGIPEIIRRRWDFINKRLFKSEPSENEKILREWEGILELSLDEDHGHWFEGGQAHLCQTHLLGVIGLHTHNAQTGGTDPC